MRVKCWLSSIFCILLCWMQGTHAFSACYPIASVSSHEVIMLQQTSSGERKFYRWDVRAKQISESLLAPYYNAALVKVLLDRSGFSFINDEMIFIKKFERRSAKKIEIDEPLYGIELIEWIDQETCYFHAYEGNRIGIYQLSSDGDLIRLKVSPVDDFLYPQLVDNKLFYIRRTHDYQYMIAKSHYPACMSEEPLIDFGKRPMILLRMLSGEKGFFIEHAPTRDTDAPYFSLSVHLLFKHDNEWETNQLFTMQIPSFLLFDPARRLYESLVPFVPFYHNNSFYFCSCNDERLAIYNYNCATKVSTIIAQSSQHLLAPLALGSSVLYGVITDDAMPQLHCCDINEAQ